MTWTETSLGKFAPFAYGKGLPKDKRIPGPVRVYGSNGVVGSHSEALVPDPAVIVGRKGSVGEVHLSEGPSWPIDTAFYVQGSDKADLHFLFYLLQTLPITSNSDSAVPGLSREYAHSIEFKAPSLKTQRAIGRTLRVFDRKISLNDSLSKTLGEIARSIFKSWFVDFDPVKAKMAGEAPVGIDTETAALFPDSMEKTEFGEVPSGWTLRSLADVVSVTKGKSYKSSELQDSPVSLVTLKSFRRGGGYREDGLKPYSGTFKAEQVVQPGELVMAFTDVTQAGDLIGVPAIVNADPRAQQLVASLDVGIVRPHSASVTNLFIYFLLKSERFREHAKAHASGTTVLHLSKDAVPNFQFAMPPDELMTKFRQIAEPGFALSDSLSHESRLLASLRDGLLPRLVSGELEIPDEMLAA